MIRKYSQGGIILCVATAMAFVLAASAADVDVYAVYKRQVYVQTTSEPPVLRCCPFVFDAVVELTQSNSVSAAALGQGRGQTHSLEAGYLEEFLPKRSILWITGSFPDQESLDRAWPGGDYTFSMFATHDGAITSTLKLAGNYPAKPPHIRNFAEAQHVDSSKDFLLRWDPFEEGTTNDFSFVLIKKLGDGVPVTNTPFIAEPNCLDGTVSEVVIPAGTLAAGAQYDVYVRFDKVVARDARAYAGAIGQASFGSGTHFTLKTLP